MLKVYNTLPRKKEVFKPLKAQKVGLYTCGPTVYNFAHIGNLRTYIFEDFLKRVLEYNSYKVKHVMNITDVGHLTSDADTGEDKIEKGAKREGKTVWQIVNFYTKVFKKDLRLLNIKKPDVWIKATETIKDQINLIKILEKKGFTYKIQDGIYFDSSKLKTYGRLWPKKMKIKAGARIAIVSGKKNPTDFALWKFTPSGVKRQMEWDFITEIEVSNKKYEKMVKDAVKKDDVEFLRLNNLTYLINTSEKNGTKSKKMKKVKINLKGFPGWHTECVVMSQKTLGIPFDIHCGAIDHILIHHTNEIAQSEAVFGKILARFWLHGEFLILKQGRMGKSEGNIITIQSLIEKELNPLAFRYLCLTVHYRSKLNFSWQAIKGAQQGLDNLYQRISDEINISSSPLANSHVTELKMDKNSSRPKMSRISPATKDYQKKFLDFVNNDLNMPRALALMWQLIKDKKISEQEKYTLLLDFDNIFGLGLKKIKKEKIPKQVLELAKEREKNRKKGNWQKADKIRIKIKKMGYLVEDTEKGAKIKCKA